VLLCGEWNEWRPIEMTLEGQNFQAQVDLSGGCSYLYKYTVDGLWKEDRDKPTDDRVQISGGAVINNIIHIDRETSPAVSEVFNSSLLSTIFSLILRTLTEEKSGEPWDREEWSALSDKESETLSNWVSIRSVCKRWKEESDLYIGGMNFWDNWLIGRSSAVGALGSVEHLLRHEEVEPQTSDSYALLTSVKGGHTEIVRLLLQDGRCDPSDSGGDALIFACTHGHAEIAEMLIADERCDPSTYENAALVAAARAGDIPIIKMILQDSRVNPARPNHLAVLEASRLGHSEIVQMLLYDTRVDPSSRSNYALRQASQHGHHETVKSLMVDKRVDPSACDNEALRMAVVRGHVETVQHLLKDSRTDPTAKNNHAILSAIRTGDHQMIGILMSDRRVKANKPWISRVKRLDAA